MTIGSGAGFGGGGAAPAVRAVAVVTATATAAVFLKRHSDFRCLLAMIHRRLPNAASGGGFGGIVRRSAGAAARGVLLGVCLDGCRGRRGGGLLLRRQALQDACDA